jgi:hypothetical protein
MLIRTFALFMATCIGCIGGIAGAQEQRIITRQMYDTVIANGNWFHGPEVVVDNLGRGRWIACRSIVQINGWSGPGGAPATLAYATHVVITVGPMLWGWDNGSGANPCLNARAPSQGATQPTVQQPPRTPRRTPTPNCDPNTDPFCDLIYTDRPR